MGHKTALLQGASPIIGPQRCIYLNGESHLNLGRLGDYGSSFTDGFYLGIDIQPEGRNPQLLLGAGISKKTMLLIRLENTNSEAQIFLELQDDYGRRLHASSTLSGFAAKRLIISVNVAKNLVDFYEINLQESDFLRETAYSYRESPNSFGNFEYDFLLGGASIDGVRVGSIAAKIGNFYVGSKPLPEDNIELLVRASRDEISAFNGKAIYEVPKSDERRALFADDFKKLETYVNQSFLSRNNTRDCSNIIFRWLFDRHPLLQDLCNELGIQLTLPCESEKSKRFHSAIADLGPTIHMPIVYGKRSFLDFRWMPLSEFYDGTALVVNGYPVTIASFVKFVRHKLGGAHFDPAERTKWQRDIVEMSNYTKIDSNFMSHHMKAVAIAVLESVLENRIAVHAQE